MRFQLKIYQLMNYNMLVIGKINIVEVTYSNLKSQISINRED